MQPQVFWIDTQCCGRLGILTRPRGNEWLRDETVGWRDARIDLVVSLLEPVESTELGLDDEATAAGASGVTFRSSPILDRGVPASRDKFAALIRDLVVALEEGKSVAVHCRQGIGRSGLIAAAVLTARGMDSSRAITAVSEARGLQVPGDDELFNETDFWQHPRTFEHLRKGDCEDHALWAWRKLIELGYPAEFFVGQWSAGGDDPHGCHAWVVFERDGERYLLEAVDKDRGSMIRPVRDVRAEYSPHFSVDAQLTMHSYAGYLLYLRERARRDAEPNIRWRRLKTTDGR
jgi:hypothetical protein